MTPVINDMFVMVALLIVGLFVGKTILSLIFREYFCWYSKINEAVQQRELLIKNISDLTKRIEATNEINSTLLTRILIELEKSNAK